jgi:hypothetical protein
VMFNTQQNTARFEFVDDSRNHVRNVEFGGKFSALRNLTNRFQSVPQNTTFDASLLQNYTTGSAASGHVFYFTFSFITRMRNNNNFHPFRWKSSTYCRSRTW